MTESGQTRRPSAPQVFVPKSESPEPGQSPESCQSQGHGYPRVSPPPAGALEFLASLLAAEKKPVKTRPGSLIRAGLDLGTASIVLIALSADGAPLGLARESACVIRDGLVVDFSGARSVAERLRRKLEAAMGVEIGKAAIAVPPGTGDRDAATHRYVCEAAGLEVDGLFEEPLAANHFLGLRDGAIADLGGGTTGAAVFEGGRMVRSFDEATGGHHLSLVLAGRLNMALERAEAFKIDPKNQAEVAPIVAPVLSKMGRILREGLKGFSVKSLHLAGGSAAAPGAGRIIADETGLPVFVMSQPELITPAGIALGCGPFEAGERAESGLRRP